MLVRLTVPLIAVALAAPLARAQSAEGDPARVVFIVADGVGIAHWSAARVRDHDLAVAGFPVVGLVDARNLTGLEPESASSATAFATGVTTFREAVGVGPDSLPRRTVLEAAEAIGMATGLVTTTVVADATPAAFAAHVVTRDSVLEIARQVVTSGVDVLLGSDAWTSDPARRARARDLLDTLARSHVIVRSPEALERAGSDPPERLAGLFDIDRDHGATARQPSLAAMTSAALGVLDANERGLFLVVESEHTDHGGHDNAPLETIVAEMVEVDRAVRVALEYRARRPGTLVVVTGDHETGGLSILPTPQGYRAAWASTDHSAEMVPIFAIGPGAERFSGILTSAEVGRALFAAIGADGPEDPVVSSGFQKRRRTP